MRNKDWIDFHKDSVPFKEWKGKIIVKGNSNFDINNIRY